MKYSLFLTASLCLATPVRQAQTYSEFSGTSNSQVYALPLDSEPVDGRMPSSATSDFMAYLLSEQNSLNITAVEQKASRQQNILVFPRGSNFPIAISIDYTLSVNNCKFVTPELKTQAVTCVAGSECAANLTYTRTNSYSYGFKVGTYGVSFIKPVFQELTQPDQGAQNSGTNTFPDVRKAKFANATSTSCNVLYSIFQVRCTATPVSVKATFKHQSATSSQDYCYIIQSPDYLPFAGLSTADNDILHSFDALCNLQQQKFNIDVGPDTRMEVPNFYSNLQCNPA